MSVLNRVKERVETDLSDAELTLMIAGVVAELDAKFGAAGVALTILKDGFRKTIDMARPLDPAAAPTITEIDSGANRLLLSADDFRIRHGGKTIERLATGTNGRNLWNQIVEVVYTPLDDTATARDEVTIECCNAIITYRGLDKSSKAGNWSASGVNAPDALRGEINSIMSALEPRPGIGVMV